MMADAVDALCKYLGRSDSETDFHTCCLVLLAFTKLSDHHHFSGSNSLAEAVTSNWRGIVDRLWTIYDAKVAWPGVDSRTRDAHVGILGHGLLAILSNIDHIAKKALHDLPAFKLVVLLWLSQDPKALRKDNGATDALILCLHVSRRESDESYGAALEAVIQALGGDADKVANLALSRLRAATEENTKVRTEFLASNLKAALILAAKRDSPLSTRFLEKHAVSSTTKAAVCLSATFPTRDEAVISAMGSYFVWGSDLLLSTTGIPWFVEALRSGLLDLLANLSPSFSSFKENVMSSIRFLVAKLLPSFLVFHSVICAAEKAFGRMTPAALSQLSKSVLGPEWESLKDLLLERLIAKHRFSSMGFIRNVDGKIRYCANVSLLLLAVAECAEN